MHRIIDAYRVDRAEGVPAVILYQFIDPWTESFPEFDRLSSQQLVMVQCHAILVFVFGILAHRGQLLEQLRQRSSHGVPNHIEVDIAVAVSDAVTHQNIFLKCFFR